MLSFRFKIKDEIKEPSAGANEDSALIQNRNHTSKWVSGGLPIG